jgi:hypothetical protein
MENSRMCSKDGRIVVKSPATLAGPSAPASAQLCDCEAPAASIDQFLDDRVSGALRSSRDRDFRVGLRSSRSAQKTASIKRHGRGRTLPAECRPHHVGRRGEGGNDTPESRCRPHPNKPGHWYPVRWFAYRTAAIGHVPEQFAVSTRSEHDRLTRRGEHDPTHANRHLQILRSCPDWEREQGFVMQ